MRQQSSSHPGMRKALDALRKDPTLELAELARQCGNIPRSTLRAAWRAEQKRIALEKKISDALGTNGTVNSVRSGGDASSSNYGAAATELVAKSDKRPPSPLPTVLVIPDLHCPWEHPDALEFLKAVKRKFRPTHIVNLGDEVDFYGMSRFDHDPDMVSPGNELSLAVRHLIPFYREFPNMLVCQSNHTHRVHAKAKKSGMPSSTIKSIEEILKTPEGWIYRRAHKIDGVVYKHGTGKSGANAHINHAKAIGQSCVIGHIHAYAAVNYIKPGMFAANFGCLIDKTAECFAYAEEMDDNIVMGCGLVIGGKEAHFIPMHTDEHGRWTGKLHE